MSGERGRRADRVRRRAVHARAGGLRARILPRGVLRVGPVEVVHCRYMVPRSRGFSLVRLLAVASLDFDAPACQP